MIKQNGNYRHLFIFNFVMGFIIMTALEIAAELVLDFPNYSTRAILYGVMKGLVWGVIFGLVYRSSFYRTMEINARKADAMRSQICEKHKIVFDEPASLFHRKTYNRGRLFLLEDELFFKTYRDDKGFEFTMRLGGIKSMRQRRRCLGLYTGMLIETVDGIEAKFIIDRPGRWIERIEAAVNQLKQAA